VITTEQKIEKFIIDHNWSAAIRTAVREDCSEDCQRKILKHLISKGLISFTDGFETFNSEHLSILSIRLFFRICNTLRRNPSKGYDSIKENVSVFPNRMHFGRSGRGEVIQALITNDFKIYLRYDNNVIFYYKKTKQIKIMFGILIGGFPPFLVGQFFSQRVP
jgi:hypothetical protein